jgi:hypothetical protein
MISTSRGLSAVRPGGSRDADADGLWHRALRQPTAAECAGDDGLDRQGVRDGGRQLIVDADDSASTATTSALVV